MSPQTYQERAIKVRFHIGLHATGDIFAAKGVAPCWLLEEIALKDTLSDAEATIIFRICSQGVDISDDPVSNK